MYDKQNYDPKTQINIYPVKLTQYKLALQTVSQYRSSCMCTSVSATDTGTGPDEIPSVHAINKLRFNQC